MEMYFLLSAEVAKVRVAYDGRHKGTHVFDARDVVLDSPIVPGCTASDESQLFPRSTAAIVEYPPSIDGSWYYADDCVWSHGSGPDARYRITWNDGDDYDGPVGP